MRAGRAWGRRLSHGPVRPTDGTEANQGLVHHQARKRDERHQALVVRSESGLPGETA